jgi:hypothetical protein
MSGQKVCKEKSMKPRAFGGMKRKSYKHLAKLGNGKKFKISVRIAVFFAVRRLTKRTSATTRECAKSMLECEKRQIAKLGTTIVSIVAIGVACRVWNTRSLSWELVGGGNYSNP